MYPQIHTGSTGSFKLTPVGTGLMLENGGLSLDGSAPVAGQITGASGGSLTSATLTTPSLVSPAVTGDATSGVMVCKRVRFIEAAAGTSYVGSVTIPAGAVVHSVKVIAEVLWNGTTATMKVGDTADDDGYFIGINLKATDLLVNEVLDTQSSTLWGGKEGAYLVAATGQRGPTASNFGMYYSAGSIIKGTVTPGAADGSAGRTILAVIYSVGEAIAQVAT